MIAVVSAFFARLHVDCANQLSDLAAAALRAFWFGVALVFVKRLLDGELLSTIGALELVVSHVLLPSGKSR